MKVIIASDHGGFQYKNSLLDIIREQGYEVADLGTFNEEPTDYRIKPRPSPMLYFIKKGEEGSSFAVAVLVYVLQLISLRVSGQASVMIPIRRINV